ncbi:TRAP transporter permease [Pelagibacterium halotolerans]|uniref:TRAP transporter permease n=1 Tax=Pelagibacterium halotolerans TaxID=531813 RepID=UPI00089C1237|nr:TRAP transporter permease [Pelagibacterium halotolerans]QJR18386.1 TRAP transporter permease [Pelagibacterium halotolerans]SEA23908.1 TRAP transporter, 4TM/12TM fusion protein [Pelagibacterium halotolerans]
MSQDNAAPASDAGPMIAQGTDEEPLATNQRSLAGRIGLAVTLMAIAYTVFHIYVMNISPLEPWAYRMVHVTGGLFIGFLTYSALTLNPEAPAVARSRSPIEWGLIGVAAAGVLYGAVMVGYAWAGRWFGFAPMPDAFVFGTYGLPLLIGTIAAVAAAWLFSDRDRERVHPADWLLGIAALAMFGYIIFNVGALRLRAGTGMAQTADFYAALVGVILILELTRRVAGLALVIIAGIFIAYSFVGPWLPGFLTHRGYTAERFFTYIFTDQGILGDPIAVSSTYIILFIVFAAFLQASRVGDYFVNFAFAAAGNMRGGPAKVAVFASGLMGMINGTSAGNVVATGSLTIPLMKKVGYPSKSAAAIEATASSGGQILPPIMGAGAFIMAEVTGIPYTEIVVAAIIPALLYFVSVYFMVDLQATKLGMKGIPKAELPKFRALAKQAFLFLPIIILIYTLFAGYSVIRAGTVAMASAAVVSWLTPYRMGPTAVLKALELGAKMSIQLVAVCAAAGIIVGVIALTGVGARFSSLLLGIAEQNQLIALFFAMCISIILGMGMPTTAAYAVAAAVVAPGLIQLGIPVLVAHFFVFYYAVMSAITPPVALAAYAGAGLSGSDPMKTSVEAFKIGLAAFIVPFMFFYSHELLMQGEWIDIARVVGTALLGMYLLSASVQGYYFGAIGIILRIVLLIAALAMIEGTWYTDLFGLAVAVGLFFYQKRVVTPRTLAKGAD